MRRRIATSLAIMAFVGGACTSTPSAAPVDIREDAPVRAAVTAISHEIQPAPLPETVPIHRPDVRVDGIGSDTEQVVATLAGVDGVAAGQLMDVAVPTSDGMVSLTALIIDPESFRSMTPDVTANVVGVWQRLRAGEIVLTPSAAHRVGAILGQPATISGVRGSRAIRVGALAANGVPQVADVLVPWSIAEPLGATEPDTLYVAVDDALDPDDIADQIQAATSLEVSVIEEPSAVTATQSAVGSRHLQSFSYQDLGDGQIRIDPSWVNTYIASMDVPVLGRVRCHRLMLPQLAGALQDLVRMGLDDLITSYSGCYVPRHILWDVNRGISRHAWGLAFDINVPSNQYGAQPMLDSRVVDVFRAWGFKWGGDFSPPDGMHFELERILDL